MSGRENSLDSQYSGLWIGCHCRTGESIELATNNRSLSPEERAIPSLPSGLLAKWNESRYHVV
jgi:hypothetical protein